MTFSFLPLSDQALLYRSVYMEQLDLDLGPEHRLPGWEKPLSVATSVRRQVEREMQTTIRVWESYERKERQKHLKPR